MNNHVFKKTKHTIQPNIDLRLYLWLFVCSVWHCRDLMVSPVCSPITVCAKRVLLLRFQGNISAVAQRFWGFSRETSWDSLKLMQLKLWKKWQKTRKSFPLGLLPSACHLIHSLTLAFTQRDSASSQSAGPSWKFINHFHLPSQSSSRSHCPLSGLTGSRWTVIFHCRPPKRMPSLTHFSPWAGQPGCVCGNPNLVRVPL